MNTFDTAQFICFDESQAFDTLSNGVNISKLPGVNISKLPGENNLDRFIRMRKEAKVFAAAQVQQMNEAWEPGNENLFYEGSDVESNAATMV